MGKKNTTTHQSLLWWIALLSNHLVNFSGSPSVMSSAPEADSSILFMLQIFFFKFSNQFLLAWNFMSMKLIFSIFFSKVLLKLLGFSANCHATQCFSPEHPSIFWEGGGQKAFRNYSRMQPWSFLRRRRRNGCGLFGVRSQNWTIPGPNDLRELTF